MIATLVLLLAGLQLKHFVADYLLQSKGMIAGKGRLDAAGGYLHAGIHAGLSLLLLVAFGVPLPWLPAIAAGEFVVHYLLDYIKVQSSGSIHASERPKLFWALHGLDQLAHHLTYTAMVGLAAVALYPGV